MKKEKTSLAEANPNLAREWHPTKNGLLTPLDVTPGSGKIVWWYLPYDDPEKGHFDFEWQAAIYSRNAGMGCPFLVNKAAWPTFNDISTTHKELARQWHPTKNGALRPTDVTAGSHKKVWWYLPYNDPKTGHHDFEWEAKICDRVRWDGCPFLSNRLVHPSYNSLAAVRNDLVEEWDDEKNGSLTPYDVVYGSYKNVWWKCKKGHSWKARIERRSMANTGCPHCIKELRTSFPERVVFYYIKKYFEDAVSGDKSTIGIELDVYIPSINTAIEYDGQRWHQDIHRDLKKNQKCKAANVKLIRIREEKCPQMKDSEDCTLVTVKQGITSSLSKAICQIGDILNVNIDVDIDRDASNILDLIAYIEKESSLENLHPEIAAMWHPTKNGCLAPNTVTAHSGKVVWWYLQYNDIMTGVHEFEWKASVRDMVYGYGCPYLSGHKVAASFNSLFTLNPDLASEWNYEKNKGLVNKKGEDISTPDKVTPGSHQKVWWKCRKGHEWQAKIENRHNFGHGCPECKKSNKTKSKFLDHSDIIPDLPDPTA